MFVVWLWLCCHDIWFGFVGVLVLGRLLIQAGLYGTVLFEQALRLVVQAGFLVTCWLFGYRLVLISVSGRMLIPAC